MSNWYITPSNDDILHYGVLGMKWGVRRYQNKDGSLTSAGRKHYGYSSNTKISNEKRQGFREVERRWDTDYTKPNGSSNTHSDFNPDARIVPGQTNQQNTTQDKFDPDKRLGMYQDYVEDYDVNKEKAKAVAMIVGGAALSAVHPIGIFIAGGGVSKLAEEARVKKVFNEIDNNTNIDKKTGLKLKQKEMTEKEDLSYVNPTYSFEKKESGNNCALCAATYILRRKGFDVTASSDAKGRTDKQICSMFKNGEKNYKRIADNRNDMRLSDTRIKAVINKMQTEENNTSGILTVSWYQEGGHALNYKVENGKFIIMDPQSNSIIKSTSSVKQFLKNTKEVNIIRTDNLEPNYKEIKGVIRHEYKAKDNGPV